MDMRIHICISGSTTGSLNAARGRSIGLQPPRVQPFRLAARDGGYAHSSRTAAATDPCSSTGAPCSHDVPISHSMNHHHRIRRRGRNTKQRHVCGCSAAATQQAAGDTETPSTSSSSLEDFQGICEKHLGCRLAEDKFTPASRQAILEASLPALEQGVKDASSVLGADVTAAWACVAPTLLLRPMETNIKQLEVLAELLSFPPEAVCYLTAEFPEWMLVPAEQLQQSYDELQEYLGLDAFGMMRVLGSNPSLMTTPLLQVKDNLFALSERIGVSAGVIKKAAGQFPTLMTLTMQDLDEKLAELSTGFDMPPDDVLRLLSAAPQLLAASVEDILGEWEVLKQLVADTPAWLKQLTTLPPHVLGACLANREFKTRMLYFYETGQLQVRYINIMSILRQDDIDFAQKYRGYVKWLREKSAEAEEEEEQQESSAQVASS